jgi:hypothetical protein
MQKTQILSVLLRKRKKKTHGVFAGVFAVSASSRARIADVFLKEIMSKKKKRQKNGEISLTVLSYPSLIPPLHLAWIQMVS